MYMLDTDACIYIIKRRPPTIQQKLKSIPIGEVAVSTTVVAELHFGVQQSARKTDNLAELERFLNFVLVLDWPEKAARKYGAIRSHLQRQGTPIGPMDLMIAAHALSQDAILVTNNTREFARVPGLRLENWIA